MAGGSRGLWPGASAKFAFYSPRGQGRAAQTAGAEGAEGGRAGGRVRPPLSWRTKQHAAGLCSGTGLPRRRARGPTFFPVPRLAPQHATIAPRRLPRRGSTPRPRAEKERLRAPPPRDLLRVASNSRSRARGGKEGTLTPSRGSSARAPRPPGRSGRWSQTAAAAGAEPRSGREAGGERGAARPGPGDAAPALRRPLPRGLYYPQF